MFKKCLHKAFANKFIHDKKYDEPILVQYTYCETCKKILKGSVTFVKAQPFPEVNPVPIIKKTQETRVKSPVQPIPIKKASIKELDKKIIEKPLKPKISPTVKTIKRPDAPIKKRINPKPPRGDSDARKNGRKPASNQAPDGASLSDILRAKYGIENSERGSQREVREKKSYKALSDPYSEKFESGEDDVFIFVK